MPEDHNAALTFRDAMRYAVRDQLAAFRLASVKRGTRGQEVRVRGWAPWHAALLPNQMQWGSQLLCTLCG